MKTIRMVACAAALTIGLAIAGCEKSDDAAPSGGTAATPSASPSSATPSQTAATPAAGATGTAADATAAQAAAKTEAPTTAPSGAATSAEVTQAQTLLDQTVTYIKENKMDLAEKGLTQLESMKAQIPAAYHPKIDQVRTAFNAAKSGGASLQGLLPGGTAAPAAPAK